LKITGAKKIREMFYQLKQEAVKEHGQMTDARFLELILVNYWQDKENDRFNPKIISHKEVEKGESGEI